MHEMLTLNGQPPESLDTSRKTLVHKKAKYGNLNEHTSIQILMSAPFSISS